MELKFGDIQETALIPLAIKASETARPNARIRDLKAKEIIDTLGVDVSKYDPFMSHEGVVARTIMFRDALTKLLKKYPDASASTLAAALMISFRRSITAGCNGSMWICPIRSQYGVKCIRTESAAQCLTEVRSNLHGQKRSRNQI
jgi:hypothetical protein